MNNINFGMDGLSLDGTTWYNAKTGDSFKIKSNFFEDNVMKVQTTDGRIFDLNRMDNYVQWSGQGEPPTQPLQSFSQPSQPIPTAVQNIIAPDNNEILADDLNMINNINTANIAQTPVVSQKTDDQKMTERVLSKASSPKVNYNITWTKYPTRQMEMLIDFMGVSLDDICDYYINNIDLNTIRESIKDQLITYINKQQVGNDDPMGTPITHPTSKKTTKKK